MAKKKRLGTSGELLPGGIVRQLLTSAAVKVKEAHPEATETVAEKDHKPDGFVRKAGRALRNGFVSLKGNRSKNNPKNSQSASRALRSRPDWRCPYCYQRALEADVLRWHILYYHQGEGGLDQWAELSREVVE